MSDRSNGPAPESQPGSVTVTATPQPELPDGLLSKIVAETERTIAAHAARPSPIHLRTWEEIERFAEKAARSGFVPKDYAGKPDAIALAVQMGSELGLAPIQSVQNIAVINGKPSVWGDAMLGLVLASGLCREVTEYFTGDGTSLTAVCVAWRKGQPKPVTQTFSVNDAVTANLWDKAIWKQYPPRMLQMRARGFALRDAFADVLKGLISREEAMDYPPDPPIVTDQPIKPASDGQKDIVADPELKDHVRPGGNFAAPSAESDWLRATVAALQAVDGFQYQRTLIAALAHAPTREEVLALGDKPGLQKTIASAPPKNRDIMNAAFADALTKFDRADEAAEARKWEAAEAREVFPDGLQDKDLRETPATP